MNGGGVIENRREQCGAKAFPEKANPNRPVPGPRAMRKTSGDAGPYPEKCNPRGRRSPLTEDQRRLAMRYLPLARSMARKVDCPKLELDELISAAQLALVEAAQSFDPAYNVNFATFARERIRGALSDCRRSWLRLAMQSDGLPSPVFQSLGRREEVLGWILSKREEPPSDAELEKAEELESYFRRLPREQARACRLIYIDGKTQTEAADLLGYSKAYLSRLHQYALESLRRDHVIGLAGSDQALGASRN
jgi:RNA polymerase sigma factor (sigma-70 family)